MHNEIGIATKTIIQTLGLNTQRNGINLEKEWILFALHTATTIDDKPARIR